jgi:predicted lipid-binding transport protein (Tim44 family)
MAEIIFFAIIAGIVLYKLRSILGEEYDDIDQSERSSSSIKDVASIISGETKLQSGLFDINQSINSDAKNISEDEKIVIRKIHAEYMKSSTEFDLALFKSVVIKVFSSVCDVYNNFKIESIKNICSDDVYSKINQIIENFKAGDKRYNFFFISQPIVEIKNVFEDRLHYKITCEIKVTQSSSFANISDDETIEGTEKEEYEIIQELTFSRMINSSGKSWILDAINIVK